MAKPKTKQTARAWKPDGATLRKELVLSALIAEMLASFVLVFAALGLGNNSIIVAVTVIVTALIFSELSGGHINPVVTVGLWATRQIGWVKALGYVTAQFIGAMLAYVVLTRFMQSNDPSTPSQIFTLFSSAGGAENFQAAAGREPGEWKPIFGEFVGALIFSFGFAAAFLGKKQGFERAFTVGGSLMVGLVAALAGSYAVLNPAAALVFGGYTQGGWWSIAAYGLAPLVAGALGACLYKWLQSDARLNPEK